jgi:hypothetical protein
LPQLLACDLARNLAKHRVPDLSDLADGHGCDSSTAVSSEFVVVFAPGGIP